MAVVQVGRCGIEIIFGGDKGKFGDKLEDFEIGEGAGGKNKDDVEKRFSCKGKIVDKDDKKKCKSKVGGIGN